MNLKDSFRYANHLDGIIDSVVGYISQSKNLLSTKKTHLRSASCEGAIDEIVETKKERTFPHETDRVIAFLEYVVTEKEKLNEAISATKAKLGFDIDTVVGLNKKKQYVAKVLSRICATKDSESVTSGSAYKFNAEGNQTRYLYDIKEVSTVDFDKSKAKDIAKKLITECDEISSKIDLAMVSAEVDYVAPYDVNDSLEEILDEYCSK